MEKLLVLIQSSNQAFLESIAGGLEEECKVLKPKLGLKDLSVLRGDLEFCKEQLRKTHDGSVIVILESVAYSHYANTNAILNAGAMLVYEFKGGDANAMITRFRGCVSHAVTGKFS